MFAENPPSRFQVLALDGGGVKALFTAHVLARLEDDLGVSVRDSFDLIAGTSAGGIIALALGAGLRPADIVRHYQQLAATVFPASHRRWWRLLARLRRPTYAQQPLRGALHEVFGDRLPAAAIGAWSSRPGTSSAGRCTCSRRRTTRGSPATGGSRWLTSPWRPRPLPRSCLPPESMGTA
jgi:predicted acylesterase/phospholipase RssA